MSTPTMFRKRPLVVEARRFVDPEDTELAQWCGGELSWYGQPGGKLGAQIEIAALDGVTVVRLGDWVVHDASGEFHALRHSTFQANYEPLVNA